MTTLELQSSLLQLGFDPGPLDGIIGPKTKAALGRYQASWGVPQTGVLDAFILDKIRKGLSAKAQKTSGLSIVFVPAKNYTVAWRTAIDLVVIHTMEAPEKPTTAKAVANWFAGASAPKASAHYSLDSDSIYQSVAEKDVAWHAPGANNNGIGIEHAGYARQTPEEWADPYSSKMLDLSARLTANICSRWNIPPVWRDPSALLQKERGITGHGDVSIAFKKSDHTDPGPHFPKDLYLDLVKKYLVLIP